MVKRIINKFSFHSLKGTMKWKKSYERGKWKLRSNKYETLWLHACFSAAIDVIIFAFFTPHYHHHLHYIIYYEISHLIFITNQVFFCCQLKLEWKAFLWLMMNEFITSIMNLMSWKMHEACFLCFFLCIINSSSCIYNEYDSWKYYVESLMKKIIFGMWTLLCVCLWDRVNFLFISVFES